jgi:hypothetical protein
VKEAQDLVDELKAAVADAKAVAAGARAQVEATQPEMKAEVEVIMQAASARTAVLHSQMQDQTETLQNCMETMQSCIDLMHGDDAELHRFDAWNEIAEQARGEGKERGEERGEEGCRCPKTGNRRERVGGGGKAGGVAACLAIGSEAAGEATGNKAAG